MNGLNGLFSSCKDFFYTFTFVKIFFYNLYGSKTGCSPFNSFNPFALNKLLINNKNIKKISSLII